MKFVDEAIIEVIAGKGGDGTVAFRREKFIPLGGPSGGDGGDGGHVILQGHEGLNTLIDFRYKRKYKAENGRPGEGSQRTGRSGNHLIIRVPIGTMIYDEDTGELIGDITKDQEEVIVARGGVHGLGNVHFKTSTNRAPRQTTKGTLGEHRMLRLELKLLADVGLLGLPNAGKSSLIRISSAARPKVADYPFTTLYPNLGVVSFGLGHSFVMADIPGVIEGAAEGAGLGIQFLKHLARTGLLLHVVDIAPLDELHPAEAVRIIEREMEAYSEELHHKPRWLVFNKIDVSAERTDAIVEETLAKLNWQSPVFKISALDETGVRPLLEAINDYLQQAWAEAAEEKARTKAAEEAKLRQRFAPKTPETPTDTVNC